MWVLVWLQLISGMPLDYFQLGVYDTKKMCELNKQKAQVMIIHNGISVQCIGINNGENK
tara:strand:+ start:194 stop:370 length:177 start_codon:yes stop_codon:yes gene_type:complete